MNIFGPRVALKIVEEEHKGLIVVPPGVSRSVHLLGSVVAVGESSRDYKNAVRPTQLSVKDIVLFQSNMYMFEQASHKSPGFEGVILHQNDMVCRLKSTKVTLKSVEMLGNWILVKPFTERTGLIILPDSASEPTEFVRYTLIQKGAWIDYDISVGDELILNKSMANPLGIDGESYCYLPIDGVLGSFSKA